PTFRRPATWARLRSRSPGRWAPRSGRRWTWLRRPKHRRFRCSFPVSAIRLSALPPNTACVSHFRWCWCRRANSAIGPDICRAIRASCDRLWLLWIEWGAAVEIADGTAQAEFRQVDRVVGLREPCRLPIVALRVNFDCDFTRIDHNRVKVVGR